MSEFEKLKPCPFCGENSPQRTRGSSWVNSDAYTDVFFIECTNRECKVKPSTKLSYAVPIDADKAWNARVPDTSLIDKAIAKVEKLIKEAYDGEWEMGLTEALEAMQQIRAKYERGQ